MFFPSIGTLPIILTLNHSKSQGQGQGQGQGQCQGQGQGVAHFDCEYLVNDDRCIFYHRRWKGGITVDVSRRYVSNPAAALWSRSIMLGVAVSAMFRCSQPLDELLSETVLRCRYVERAKQSEHGKLKTLFAISRDSPPTYPPASRTSAHAPARRLDRPPGRQPTRPLAHRSYDRPALVLLSRTLRRRRSNERHCTRSVVKTSRK